MTRHTPGPWMIEPAVPGEASGTHVWAANPKGSATDGDKVTIADFVDNEANARLIAAAPDLFAVLKRAVGAIRAFHGIGLNGPAEADMWALYQQSPEMQAINAAIAKAEAVPQGDT